MVHHAFVVAPVIQTPRKPARDRPHPLSADTGPQCHCVQHQTTDPTVAIRKVVNVVETMVRRSNRNNPVAGRVLRQPIALFKMRHEFGDSMGRRRVMAANCYFGVTILAYSTGDNFFPAAIGVFEIPEFLRHFLINGPVHS